MVKSKNKNLKKKKSAEKDITFAGKQNQIETLDDFVSVRYYIWALTILDDEAEADNCRINK